MKVMKKYVTVDGKRHVVWIDLAAKMIDLATQSGPMSVPADHHEYSYTHGGKVYRAACDLFWKLASERIGTLLAGCES